MTDVSTNKETTNGFLNRTYVNFVHDIALVYPSKIGKGVAIKWSIRQARDYLAYLKQQEEILI